MHISIIVNVMYKQVSIALSLPPSLPPPLSLIINTIYIKTIICVTIVGKITFKIIMII